ncbi:ABC transporter, partial [Enterococcus durans]|nr:ABC transporter [Enterococcus durans]
MSMESYYGDLDTYISNEGDGKYNVLKFQDDLSTFGLADRGLTWVSDDMFVSGDEDKVLAEKDGKTYETQQSHIGDKDLIPAYVRLSAEDNTTVSNNNSNIFNYAMPLISTWIQDGGLTDDAWNEYVSTMKQQGVGENVKLWQKWYDKTMAQE